MDILIVRLSAPLLSFGGALIDHYGPIRSHPACSMITGLLGNALGYDHREWNRLQCLQDRLHFAVRCDIQGEKIRDYQTVDLSQDFFQKTGWTTFGSPQERDGGEATKNGTHIRYRDYWAGAVYTLAISLEPEEAGLDVESLALALKEPKRPLFIGRKNCIPSDFLFQGILEAESLLDALLQFPLSPLALVNPNTSYVKIWVESDDKESASEHIIPITDERDWANQIHTGRRLISEMSVSITQFKGGFNAK